MKEKTNQEQKKIAMDLETNYLWKMTEKKMS